jgi:UDP-glucose 4-epimerase
MERNHTVIITGIAGLIGSRLAHWIIENTNSVVIGIDDLSGGFIENVPPNVELHIADVATCDFDSIIKGRKIDLIFHFSSFAAECLSPFIRKYNHMTNIVATSNVINAVINNDIGKIIYTSSMAVYGNQRSPFSEDLPYAPIDSYGISKAACEQEIIVAGEQHGIDWCICRPHNVFGRSQNLFDPYRNFIGIAMYKVLHDDPVTVYGDGLQTRAFSYIDDALGPLWQAGVSNKTSKQIINLGGIYETSILDAAKMVIEVAGRGELIHLPPRHEVKHAYASWDKSVDLLGFEHKTSLRDGIADMWEWAQVQQDRPRRIFQTYEVERGLYPQWKPEALKDGFWKKNND